jgi:5-methylcytosine-specific restriction endonuclease McrA
MFLFNYHPGPFPRSPDYPGKRSSFPVKAWYYWECWRWRNHHKKQSPWWDHYRRYLKSRAWDEVRAAVLHRDNYRCQRCDSRNKLQSHHRYYRYVGKEWEQLSCLVTLCEDCHWAAHGMGAAPRSRGGLLGWLWSRMRSGRAPRPRFSISGFLWRRLRARF